MESNHCTTNRNPGGKTSADLAGIALPGQSGDDAVRVVRHKPHHLSALKFHQHSIKYTVCISWTESFVKAEQSTCRLIQLWKECQYVRARYLSGMKRATSEAALFENKSIT